MVNCIKKFKKETEILIGQPLIYPEILLSRIRLFFDSKKIVNKAYFACIQYPFDDSLKLLIGLKTINNISEALEGIEGCLEPSNTEFKLVNFVNADDTAFKDYFSKIKPFYEQ